MTRQGLLRESSRTDLCWYWLLMSKRRRLSQFQRAICGMRARMSRRFGVGLLVRREPERAEAAPRIVWGTMTDLISLAVKSHKVYR